MCSTAPIAPNSSPGAAEIRGMPLSLRLFHAQSAVLVLCVFVFFSRSRSGIWSAFLNRVQSVLAMAIPFPAPLRAPRCGAPWRGCRANRVL